MSTSNVFDAHVDTINFVVTRNKIYPQFHYAFSDGTEQSIFSNNDVFGGNGGIYKRGSLTMEYTFMKITSLMVYHVTFMKQEMETIKRL
jgi:hypothetical protein